MSKANVMIGSSENRHLPALDGVRGIAILLVLLSHAVDFLGPIPQSSHTPGAPWIDAVKIIFLPGWGGVDLFFALSGFLITGILLRSKQSPSYFSSFYARRTLRIFPIYYLFLIASLCLAMWSPALAKFLPTSLKERASYFIYLQNWPIFWKNWTGMSGLWGAYWSLAVEEQFYLIWPTLIRLFKPSRMLFLCIIGFLLGLPERALLTHHLFLQLGILQWPFSRLDGLFLGAAIALYREEYRRVVPLRYAVVSFSLGVVLYLSIAIFRTGELEGAGVNLWTIGITSFALMSAGIIAAVEHRPPFLIRILTIRPLLLAGRYSYGIYVYHLIIYFSLRRVWYRYVEAHVGYHPFTSLTFIALTMLISFGVAAASFHLIEAPFLRLKRFFPSPAAPV
jgi:peptidoglycan/LPS O-acetylase OafA/YrhL